jgi:hypothetical protein
MTPNKIATKKDVDILADYADIYAELNEVDDEEYRSYVHDLGLSDEDY